MDICISLLCDLGRVHGRRRVGTNSVRRQRTGNGTIYREALNTTANQRGKVVLDLYAFDPTSGKVRGYFSASEGLTGDAWLTGSVDNKGRLELVGSLLNMAMEVHGSIGSKRTIRADYTLAGMPTQRGTFEAAFQHQLPDSLNADGTRGDVGLADLIGTWEVGGGMPGSVNPVTGETSGISFVEGRKLEILPDGEFKHILSHRHCEGTGVGRCCTEDATLEQGPVEIRGGEMIFDITGGGTISRNSCRPSSLKEGSVKTHKQVLHWKLRSPQSAMPVLCLQNGNDAPACYEKQP